MRSAWLARAIVRLYPRGWRARYVDEVLALVEQTGLGFRRTVDLIRGAAREWMRLLAEALLVRWHRPSAMFFESLILTATITAIGYLVASRLSTHVVTPPVIWFEDGHRYVLPPRVPGYLGLSGCLIGLLAFVRVFRRLRPKTASFARAVNPNEFGVWIVALTLSSVGMFWATFVSHLGTGLPPASVPFNVGFIALMTQVNVHNLLQARVRQQERGHAH